ncbi:MULTISPECIES: 2-keto-4-pentenoate hydratase [Sphingomonadaceae]|uniref:2-keto-4-pentenoate hydratase n=1 Tax=Sphingomonadaceae TaxID=41297 RepID=UPI0000DD0505|nr:MULTISPECIES: fumarylacetoacetate hydrolase family protein [Sphingomonadaceae]QDK35689.1 2-keto-4-pentenoate hydratase [Sphingomonas sp. IC081]QSR20500.1 2-keto-4-pentenoate hydratase [Novosphingobium sp. KA1]BAF03316.1 2-hydroxypenta-2,4-dienoate hydratase [Novosphingobium sp. KA1]
MDIPTKDHIRIAADRLKNAYTGPAVAPLRDLLDPVGIDDAYAIQERNTRAWEAEGRRIVGRKIGLTAKAVQAQLGVDQPDFGVLFEDMRVADGGRVGAGLLQPKAEAEVALVLGRDLTGNAPSEDEIAAATDYAVAAIEIVDSRIADWKITFADTVADNGSSARFVLGSERKALPGLDLYTCGMVLEVNGQPVSIGAGAACLGHPLKAAAWLARTLAERGEPLRAGDIILTGALGPMVALAPGQHVRAIIGGLGEVQFHYDGDA